MKWTYTKLAEPGLGLPAFRLQLLINASFVSGSLTGALLNIAAIAAVSLAKRYLPARKIAKRASLCHG